MVFEILSNIVVYIITVRKKAWDSNVLSSRKRTRASVSATILPNLEPLLCTRDKLSSELMDISSSTINIFTFVIEQARLWLHKVDTSVRVKSWDVMPRKRHNKHENKRAVNDCSVTCQQVLSRAGGSGRKTDS